MRPGRTRRLAGFTLIELAEAIVAVLLGRWLALVVSGRLEGLARTLVFWAVAVVASLAFFFALLYGVGFLLDRFDRGRDGPRTPYGER